MFEIVGVIPNTTKQTNTQKTNRQTNSPEFLEEKDTASESSV
jgi:hypothetical protein